MTCDPGTVLWVCIRVQAGANRAGLPARVVTREPRAAVIHDSLPRVVIRMRERPTAIESGIENGHQACDVSLRGGIGKRVT